MPALSVRANQGETLDALVWRSIGGGAASVDAALAANRSLAALGPALPEGTLVVLPESNPAPQPIALVQLWD